jgi:hypothetical protein
MKSPWSGDRIHDDGRIFEFKTGDMMIEVYADLRQET